MIIIMIISTTKIININMTTMIIMSTLITIKIMTTTIMDTSMGQDVLIIKLIIPPITQLEILLQNNLQ